MHSVCIFARGHLALGATLMTLAVAAAGCGTSSGGSGGGGSADASPTGDTAGTLDGGAKADGGGDGATLGDGQGAGDAAKTDAAKDSAAADVPMQDTGATKDTIAANLAAAKKAEVDLYLAFCKANLTCDTGLYLSQPEACKDLLLADGGLVFFSEGLLSIQSGRATFDATQVAACIATIDAKCTFFNAQPLPAACSAMFKGSVDDGFGCDRTEDCKTGYCKKNLANDAECPGICTKKLASGAACDDPTSCAAPDICLDSGKCGAYVLGKKGDDCTFAGCEAGLICLGTDTAASCEQPVATGGTCTVMDYVCGSTGYCVAPNDTSDGKCAPLKKAGEACDKNAWYDGISENPCGAGLVCVPLSDAPTATATCKATSPIGGPCLIAEQCPGYDQGCFVDAKGVGTCDWMPSKGEACEPLSDEDIQNGYIACMPPFVCDDKSKVCVPRPAAGKPCLEYVCAQDLYCDADTVCQAHGKLGDACTTNDDGTNSCVLGLVCGAKSSKCETPTCK